MVLGSDLISYFTMCSILALNRLLKVRSVKEIRDGTISTLSLCERPHFAKFSFMLWDARPEVIIYHKLVEMLDRQADTFIEAQ